jgi:hypothetical protein
VLEKGIGALQSRAAGLLGLAQGAAGAELNAAISLAKNDFGVGPLVEELRAITDPTQVPAALEQRSGAFLQRVLGPEIKKVSATQLGSVVTRIHGVLAKIDEFEQNAYDAITDALTQNLSLALHADYSRASDNEALVDVLINAGTTEGVALLHAAALGDFTDALDGSRPDLVRVQQGSLTRNLVKTQTVGVNVVGWHVGWHYQSVEQVIAHSDQQIVPAADGGGVMVVSTLDLTKTTEQDRQTVFKKTRDVVRTNFLLRFVGESHGVLESDPASQQYLVDTIARMAATYTLSFDDDHTTSKDLAYYLSFARDFGIVEPTLSPDSIGKLLPLRAVDDYGAVTATYTVRYTEAGLRRLFLTPPAESLVRKIMRKVILTNFLAIGSDVGQEGWAYWTGGIYDFWKQNSTSFVHLGNWAYHSIDPTPYPDRPNPPSVTLSVGRQHALSGLYGVEDTFVQAFRNLAGWIAGGKKIAPITFQQGLATVGDALADIDRFAESVNATFALFDALLINSGAQRASSLTLQSVVGGRWVKKVFLSH